MTSDNIYLSHQGETLGSYSHEEIEARERRGRITPDTLIWHEGMAEWARFEDLDRGAQDITEKTIASTLIKPGASKDSLEGVRGFTLDYLLFWHGVVQPTGWTRLRLTYDYASNTLLELRVLESTGTTNTEMSEMAFGIGFFLGEALMKEALNGR